MKIVVICDIFEDFPYSLGHPQNKDNIFHVILKNKTNNLCALFANPIDWSLKEYIGPRRCIWSISDILRIRDVWGSWGAQTPAAPAGGDRGEQAEAQQGGPGRADQGAH